MTAAICFADLMKWGEINGRHMPQEALGQTQRASGLAVLKWRVDGDRRRLGDVPDTKPPPLEAACMAFHANEPLSVLCLTLEPHYVSPAVT
jgi:hypothetical protein